MLQNYILKMSHQFSTNLPEIFQLDQFIQLSKKFILEYYLAIENFILGL